MVDLLKTFLSKEMKIKIDEYLFKMKSTKFLSELNLDLNSNISLKSYSLNDLEHDKSIWLEVANLSIYLYVEYEFFRQFSFPNRYKSQIYEERLKKLGYKQHKGIWKINQIPNEQFIIENIFYCYFYMFLCQEKKNELDNEKFTNENFENSIKIRNFCNPTRNNNTNVNNTINEEITYENIDHVVLPIIGEMLSSEVSNENKIDCVEHVENIVIKPADNKDKWTCTQCTFINKISVDLCEICLAPNINKIGTMNDNKLPEETWCCKRCGENNSFECYKCKNCRVPAEFFNKWRCEQCSYYNDKIAIRCGACEIGNPYLIKCNICSKTLVNKKYDKICKECVILPELCINNDTDDFQDNKETQSTTSEFINLLPRITNRSQSKGDRNSGKLIENQMKSNEDIQQNLENKDKIKKKNAKFKKNKMNSKRCKNCKSKDCANNQYWCIKCENFQWYCLNKACDGINFQNEFCKQCKAKKGSDFSNCNKFWIIKDKKEVQMWQCEYCLQFIAGHSRKCIKCINLNFV